MSFQVEIGDVLARCSRADLPDAEAEAMIEAAALSAADQVRKECRTRRQTEKSVFDLERRMDASQAKVADGNRERIETEAESSKRRNAAETAANRTGSGVRSFRKSVQ